MPLVTFGYGAGSGADPVISGAAINDSSINVTNESAIVTCSVTNMVSGNIVYVTVNDREFIATTSDYTTYSTTLYGSKVGQIASGTVTITAVNSEGSDTDTSLTLTVADTDVEAVVHIYNILNAEWDAGNVTEPTYCGIGIGPDARATPTKDVIKLYRSPRRLERKPRARRNYETRIEYVQISMITNNVTPRAQLEKMRNEVLRIINSKSTIPGGGYTHIWAEDVDVRGEYSSSARAVMDISLDKVYRAVNV